MVGGRLRKVLLGIPLAALAVLGVFGFLPFIATCGGHDEAMTAVLLKCPRAKELLGDDAHPARLGIACGSTETSGSTGSASWRMAYTGERGRGTVSYNAEKVNDEWQIRGAMLEVDDEQIDLLTCGPYGRQMAQTPADGASATFSGKVIRSTHATVLTGSTCSGTLKRERGAATAHVTVECQATAESTGAPAAPVPIYDGDGAFTMNVKDPAKGDDDEVDFDDGKTEDEDSTPGCRLTGRGTGGTLTIWGKTPAYELVIAL